MADMERAVGITNQLYRCRRAARTLLGDKFEARMQELGNAIREVAKRRDTSELKATIAIGQAAHRIPATTSSSLRLWLRTSSWPSPSALERVA